MQTTQAAMCVVTSGVKTDRKKISMQRTRCKEQFHDHCAGDEALPPPTTAWGKMRHVQ